MDADCITPDLKPWFLEWTLRFGYSAIYLLLYFIKKGKLANFFLDGFKTSIWKKFTASWLLGSQPLSVPAHGTQPPGHDRDDEGQPHRQ